MVELKNTEDFLRFLRFPRELSRTSAWSKRSRCGAVRICKVPDEPSEGIAANLLLANWSLEVVALFARRVRSPPGPRQLF